MKLGALIGALAVLTLAFVVFGRDGEDPDSPERSRSMPGETLGPAGAHRVEDDAGDLLAALRTLPLPDLELTPSQSRRPRGPRHLIARVSIGDTVDLLKRPDGELVARLGDRTEFGSGRALGVAGMHDGWLGVMAPELPNGSIGWIREDDPAIELYETRFWMVADLSARELQLRYGRRLLDHLPITVGSPSSPTPVGRYAVTDALAGKEVGPYYGCCILALSGHQPELPPNWLGGDRIAIHGTPAAVGGAASAGCLRASNDDMVSLFARVPLGAPVFVRA